MSHAGIRTTGNSPAGPHGKETFPTAIDLLAAFVTPALFTRPSFRQPGAFSEHLPCLFWLLDAILPRLVVSLGANDGIAHFAACQALDRLGTGKAWAFGDWANGAPPALLSEFSKRHYQGVSEFHQDPPANASTKLDAGSVDLLILDVGNGGSDRHVANGWEDHLSDRGVAILHGIGCNTELSVRRDDRPSFLFPHGNGLAVVGPACTVSPQLDALFHSSGYPDISFAVRQMFERLGRAIACELGSSDTGGAESSPDTRRVIADLEDRLVARDLAKAEEVEVIASLRSELDAKREIIARQDRELGELADRLVSFVDARDQLSVTSRKGAGNEGVEMSPPPHGEATATNRADSASLQAMTDERDAIAAIARDRDIALAAERAHVARLEADLVRANSELGQLAQMIEEERTRTRMTENEIAALLASTSWRVTSPLRMMAKRLRR